MKQASETFVHVVFQQKSLVPAGYKHGNLFSYLVIYLFISLSNSLHTVHYIW